MSNDSEKKTPGLDQQVNRRGVLGKAAVVMGAAAASLVAGKSAVARPDIAVDESGRVIVKGEVIIHPVEPAAARTDVAAADTGEKKKNRKPSLSKSSCINHSRRQSGRKFGETLLAGRGK